MSSSPSSITSRSSTDLELSLPRSPTHTAPNLPSSPLRGPSNVGLGPGQPRHSGRSQSDWHKGPAPANSRRSDEQTMAEFLREDVDSQGGADFSAESRRQSIMAMDRKRRLAGSTHDGGRRRANNGIFHERSASGPSLRAAARLDGPSSSQHYPRPRRADSQEGPEIIDLTGSSPLRSPPRPRPQTAQRTSSSASSHYTVPKWQLDSEVSECPICKRPFSFLFRRHHCRKCGRVVCNDCSPHRITIPRQFIVNPSGSATTEARPLSTGLRVETVDLTADEDESGSTQDVPVRRASHSALGGGEKVRLCNPCVPDPQPSPLPVLTVPSDAIGRNEGSTSPPTLSRRSEPGSVSQQDWEQFRNLHRQRARGMMFHPESGSLDTARRHEVPEQVLPPFGTLDYTVVPDDLRQPGRPPHYQSEADVRVAPPGYINPDHAPGFFRPFGLTHSGSPFFSGMMPGPMRRPPSMPMPMPMPPHAYSRFSSVDGLHRPAVPGGSRTRVRSMFDVDPHHSAFTAGSSASQPMHQGQPRPRYKESDICPICRRLLPPKGIDGDEAAREAHIMECISSREGPTSQSAPGGRQSLMLSPSRAPVQMLPFIATEKDCLGEDGSVQECSICMVEYDVGDQMCRLECLCRFHRECIEQWFGRKRECPVHKIA